MGSEDSTDHEVVVVSQCSGKGGKGSATVGWGVHHSVLRIGTEALPARKLESIGHQVLLTCAKLATHAENIAHSFKADQEGILHKERKYFDFNVVRWSPRHKVGGMASIRFDGRCDKAYLKDLTAEIKACSEDLKMPTIGISPSKSAAILGPIKL
jgi:hypothetical protein